MSKFPPRPVNVPTRQDIANRIKDELRGVQQGTGHVDFGTPGMHPDAPVVPSIEELGLPMSIRRKFEVLALQHVSLGKAARDATKQRDTITAEVKGLFQEHIPADVPSFYCNAGKLTSYTQHRSSFSQDAARDELLRLGVPSEKIAKAWAAATSLKPTVTLRITPPGESDE